MRCLAQGDVVRVLSRKSAVELAFPDSVKIYQTDLLGDSRKLGAFLDGAEILYHCAGEIANPSLMWALHVDGTRKLLNAAAGNIGHWVQLSSVGAYGHQVSGLITEETPLNPKGVYELSKTEADKLVIEWGEKSEFTFTILRPSIVFGNDMKNHSLFQMINMIDKGLFFFIGKAGASANYIHVDNVIDAIILCGTRSLAKGKIYILSDYCTIEEFVGIIADELGRPVPTLRLPEIPVRVAARLFGRLPKFPLTESRVDALVNRSMYSIKCIQSDLGYTHVMPMEKGLRQMVHAWKKMN